MIFQKQKGILSARLDDKLLIFNTEKNVPYSLNDVAAFVFINTEGELSTEQLAQMICNEYNIEIDQALNDIRELYNEFVKKDIVKKVG